MITKKYKIYEVVGKYSSTGIELYPFGISYSARAGWGQTGANLEGYDSKRDAEAAITEYGNKGYEYVILESYILS